MEVKEVVDTTTTSLWDMASSRESIIAIISGLAVVLVLWLTKLPGLMYRRLRADRIIVSAISRTDSPDLQAFIEIYERRIPEQDRVSNDDIIRWVGRSGRNHHKGREDYTLVAKHNGEVLAIAKVMFSRNKRLCFVAYLAAKGSTRKSSGTNERLAVAKLVRWIATRIKKQKTKAVVFEVAAGTSQAKLRKFREYAVVHDRACCRMELQYVQPDMESTTTESERQMNLLYVGYGTGTGEGTCSLLDAMEVLDFLYSDIYYETFLLRNASDESNRYRDYLDRLMATQVRTMEGRVKISRI